MKQLNLLSSFDGAEELEWQHLDSWQTWKNPNETFSEIIERLAAADPLFEGAGNG